MLAHISTNRSVIARDGLKSWGRGWREIEPHLDTTIADFLHGLPQDHKNVCLMWMNLWSEGDRPGKHVLKGLAETLSRS
jgi:hypothetical protein